MIDLCDDSADPEDVMVLVHGTAGTALDHYSELIPLLRHRYRILAPGWNSRGLGHHPDGAIPALCDQIEKNTASRLGRGRRTLVGYSLGAVIAAALAARSPGLWTHLVLIAGWCATTSQQRLRQRLLVRLSQQDPEALREFLTFTAFGERFLSALSDSEVAEVVDAMEAGSAVREQAVINASIDIRHHLPNIQATTLVIGCSDDLMVPPAHGLELRALITGSSFVELPAGHAVLHEAPELVAQAIQRFHESSLAVNTANGQQPPSRERTGRLDRS